MKLRRTLWERMTIRAQRGARFLDRVSPGWYRKINIDRLDLRSNTDCICAQLLLNTIYRDDLPFGLGAIDLYRHGFIGSGNPMVNKLHKSIWVAEINERLQMETMPDFERQFHASH